MTNQLHRKLSSFGVLLLTLSCLSPVFSIYGVGSDVLLHAGTGAAGTFICGIGVALIWAVVYAELGSAYPYAGGDYVGVGSVLGGVPREDGRNLCGRDAAGCLADDGHFAALPRWCSIPSRSEPPEIWVA